MLRLTQRTLPATEKVLVLPSQTGEEGEGVVVFGEGVVVVVGVGVVVVVGEGVVVVVVGEGVVVVVRTTPESSA